MTTFEDLERQFESMTDDQKWQFIRENRELIDILYERHKQAQSEGKAS